MANFDTSAAKLAAVRDAIGLLPYIQSIYASSKHVQALLAAYQAQTDPVFVAAINALHTPAERQELGQMLAQISALVTDWEANHRGALGLP